MRRWRQLVLAGSAACLLGSGVGCQQNDLVPESPRTIKVAVQQVRAFDQQFGNLFMIRHPEIELDVVAYPAFTEEAKLLAWMEEERPDVWVVGEGHFQTLAAQHALVNLETVKQDALEWGALHSGVQRKLRLLGDGAIYGMSPQFTTTVLYANLDLFDHHGVSVPQEQLSWNDYLQLLQRFPATTNDGKPLYGLDASLRSSFDVAHLIGRSNGLQLFDAQTNQLLLHTDPWRNVLQLVANPAVWERLAWRGQAGEGAAKQAVLPSYFMSGQAVTTIESTLWMDKLGAPEGINGIRGEVFRWGMLPVPTDDPQGAGGTDMTLRDIFAISASSPQTAEALLLIQFVHGADVGRVLAKEPRYIITRKGSMKPRSEENLDALYAQQPSEIIVDEKARRLESELTTLLEPEMKQFVAQELTVDEAVQLMEQKGNARLLR